MDGSLTFLFLQKGCDGFEDRIEDCRFERRKFGSGVCDLHPNLGLRCLPFHHEHDKTSDGHWRGLRFESASFRKDLTSDNTLYVSNSKSRLVHVEIIGAGSGKYLGKSNTTSAIETWGVPPIMEFMLVTNSAYNGEKKLPFRNFRCCSYKEQFLFRNQHHTTWWISINCLQQYHLQSGIWNLCELHQRDGVHLQHLSDQEFCRRNQILLSRSPSRNQTHRRGGHSRFLHVLHHLQPNISISHGG